MKSIIHLFRWLVSAPIRIYRAIVSPLLPPSCIYSPTCSKYSLDALMKHGIGKGSILAITRITRCTGLFFTGGEDPVPDSFSFSEIGSRYRDFRRRKKSSTK